MGISFEHIRQKCPIKFYIERSGEILTRECVLDIAPQEIRTGMVLYCHKCKRENCPWLGQNLGKKGVIKDVVCNHQHQG